MGVPFGRYELLEKLAEGGMAEVFRAIQLGIGGFEKLVALKMIRPHLEDEPGFIDLLLHEARIAALLSHPSVCQILDVGMHDGRYFIAMEHISGLSLAHLLKLAARARHPVSPALGAFVVARAAEGLAHAHEKIGPDGRLLGIVHRDVSPDNIMVDEDGRVKVVDFGIAHAANRIVRTQPGRIRGKLRYMSPEQVRGCPLDGRSDVFSLGVILHQLIAGRPLFLQKNDLKTMECVLNAPIPELAERPGVPRELCEATHLALERAVDRRLPSARDLARRIDESLRDVETPWVATLAALVRALRTKPEVEQTVLNGELVETRTRPAVPPTIELAPREFPPGAYPTRLVGSAAPTVELRPLTRELPSDSKPRHSGRLARVAGAGAALLALIALLSALGRSGSPEHPVGQQVTEARPLAERAPDRAPAREIAASSTDSATERTAPGELASVQPGPAYAARRRTRRQPPLQPPVPSRTVSPVNEGAGWLTLDTSPWSYVYLGARLLGPTPLFEVQLPAGTVTLRAVNESAQIDRGFRVEIVPGRTVVKRIDW